MRGANTYAPSAPGGQRVGDARPDPAWPGVTRATMAR